LVEKGGLGTNKGRTARRFKKVQECKSGKKVQEGSRRFKKVQECKSGKKVQEGSRRFGFMKIIVQRNQKFLV
jgi:hypothetical protein